MNQLRIQIAPQDETLLVDEIVILTDFCIDYKALVRSAREEGDYFILTCSCGDAGCAGLFAPIQVRHHAESIAWHITEPEPMRDFVFSKVQYVAEIRKALEKTIQINATLPEDEQLGPHGIYQENLEALLNDIDRAEVT